MPNTCLIIPCYNEARRLEVNAFIEFLENNPHYSICFADDGSTDDTIAVIKIIQSAFPKQTMLIQLTDNKGKAEAIRLAVNKMAEQHQFSYFGYFDADLSSPLQEARRFVDLLEANPPVKIIFGSRISGGDAIIKKNYLRHFSGRCFSFFVNHFFSIRLYDTQCGAKVFRQEIIPVAFSSPFISRWLFDIEIMLRLRRVYGNDENSIAEEPLKKWVDKKGSKIRFVDLLRLPAEMRAIKKVKT